MKAEIETLLTGIAAEYRAAERQLGEIRERMAEVERAGMYPALPTEQWRVGKYLPEIRRPN